MKSTNTTRFNLEALRKMPKAWTDKSEYSKFSDEIAKAQDRGFEEKILPLLRLNWPDVAPTPALGWIDRSGIDLMVWSDTQPYSLVVQCKGFKVPEEQIGTEQIKQCLKSIESFRKSGLKAHTYLLIHNRTGMNKELRESVNAELESLVTSGQVIEAEIWDRQRLLKNAFNVTLGLVRQAVEEKRNNAQAVYGDHLLCEPLTEVPFNLTKLLVAPGGLLKESPSIECDADPVNELLKTDESNLLLILGEAGYGKTTAILRTFSSIGHLTFYIPAASIPKQVNNSTSLLRHCVRTEDLFENPPNSDTEVFRRIFHTVINFIFKESGLPVLLLIDGLDESVYFSRRGGVQDLFNQVRDLKIPVVMAARTEFWSQRRIDFNESFTSYRSSDNSQQKEIRLIELRPWKSAHILSLAKRFQDKLSSSEERQRIGQLIDLIRQHGYDALYGDIPQRPLFLNFILETVAANGVQKTGKAKLFYDWAFAKIRRDIFRPMKWGNTTRQPILSENEAPETTCRLAFRAMMLAAHCMTGRLEDEIELLNECLIDDVLLLDRKLSSVTDPTGLFLNSLLIPGQPALPHQQMKIRFAHRAYQEFFLALYVRENPAQYAGYKLPESVEEYVNDLAATAW